MSANSFVDTNILVYAYDRSAGEKHDLAKRLIETLWNDNTGIISTQVLQEFYVNVRRKVQSPLSATEARKLIEDYLSWKVVVNDGAALLEAIEIEQRYQLSFWDALIVQAANTGSAEVLYSEDLNAGQRYGEVRVENPFLVVGVEL
jgi:predicted nucleic acid-binding protein